MREYLPRSVQFRRERIDAWLELDNLVARVERHGLRALAGEEIRRLVFLYRAVLSSVSVARATVLDRGLVAWLESLAARAWAIVHGPTETLGRAAARLLARRFPARVRALAWELALAAAVFAAGVAAGWGLVHHDPATFHAIVPPDLAAGRGPDATTEELRAVLREGSREPGGLALLAGVLFQRNARVGLLAFAVGFAGGVPTLLVLLANGMILGAFGGLHADRGLLGELLAWVAIHGTTEILAVLLCGAAGLSLARAWLAPGRLRRRDRLARAGREAAAVVLGAGAMFLVAALLEGFARQLVTNPAARATIGGLAAAGWLVFFALAGRERDDG